ncbi:hypothetical protein AB834_00210 [PVC group bacterium (ex Bugula neritina AB1)]|nr:hypothetical protein AB834_00210 [PVC group bacterium (ex Bugula neritina AB1)]
MPLVFLGGSTPIDSYLLELTIWTGDKVNDLPSQPTYTITKENTAQSTSTDNVDVARLIDDFIAPVRNVQNTTGIINGLNTVWVRYRTVLNFGNSIEVNQDVTTTAVKGYAYGNEGKNFQTGKRILLDGDEFDAHKDSLFLIPFTRDENTETGITVTGFPSGNQIYLNNNLVGSTNTQGVVSIFNIDCSEATGDERIDVNLPLGFTKNRIYIYLREECKHTPYDVTFINRYGHEQNITFFKERTDTVNVESESYERSFGQPSGGVHQFVDFNTNAKQTITLSTGYLEEGINESIKQLLLSERIWIGSDPVNIKTKSQTLQTRNNNRLISYTIEFEYSYNLINTI